METSKNQNCSTQVLNLSQWKVFISLAGLARYAKNTREDSRLLVYLALLSYTNPQKNTCYPSVERLAEQVSRSRRTVQRCIKELQNMELIQVNLIHGKGNEYTVLSLEDLDENPVRRMSKVSRVTKQTGVTPIARGGDKLGIKEVTNLTQRDDNFDTLIKTREIKQENESKEIKQTCGFLPESPKPDEEKKPCLAKKESVSQVIVDEIYQAYPRKENPLKAKTVIRDTINRVSKEKSLSLEKASDFLLLKTKQFRDSPKGRGDKKFILYPERWYAYGGYDSDPSSWNVETKNQILTPIRKVQCEVDRTPVLTADDIRRQQQELEEFERRKGLRE